MTFVIAEVGSNWRTKKDCLKAIDRAIDTGADAVKFQLYSHQSLYGYPGTLGDGVLDPMWFSEFQDRCADMIEFMCSAFSVDDALIVDPFVDRHKVASSDMLNFPMIEQMISSEKPLIVSTGGHTLKDVGKLVKSFLSSKFGRFTDFTLLYCESSYPSRRHNLEKMSLLKRFGCPIGFSDHTTDVFWAPVAAVKYFGATIIEKHFNPLGFVDTPDCGHSLDFYDFTDMVQSIRKAGIETDIYDSKGEAPMREFHNRRQTEHGFYRVKPS